MTHKSINFMKLKQGGLYAAKKNIFLKKRNCHTLPEITNFVSG